MHMHVENNVSSIETGFIYRFFAKSRCRANCQEHKFPEKPTRLGMTRNKKINLSDSFESAVPTTCTGYNQNPFTSFQLRPCGRIDTSPALCVNSVLLAPRLHTKSVPVWMKILLVCYKDRSAKLYSRNLVL